MGPVNPKRDSRGRFASGGSGVTPPQPAPTATPPLEAEIIVDGKAPLRAQSLSAAMEIAEQLLSDGVDASVRYPASDASATDRIRAALPDPAFRLRSSTPVTASPRDDVRGEAVELLAGTVEKQYVGRTASGDLVRVDTVGVDEDDIERILGVAQRIEVNATAVSNRGEPWPIFITGPSSVDTNRPL